MRSIFSECRCARISSKVQTASIEQMIVSAHFSRRSKLRCRLLPCAQHSLVGTASSVERLHARRLDAVEKGDRYGRTLNSQQNHAAALPKQIVAWLSTPRNCTLLGSLDSAQLNHVRVQTGETFVHRRMNSPRNHLHPHATIHLTLLYSTSEPATKCQYLVLSHGRQHVHRCVNLLRCGLSSNSPSLVIGRASRDHSSKAL